MPSLNIRNFPGGLLHNLKSAALTSRQSLREYVIEWLESAVLTESVNASMQHDMDTLPRKVTKVTLPEPEVILPSMDHLRDICAGITTAHALEMVDMAVHGINGRYCSYTEYDEQTGETYACGLSVHSAKVKHTRGRRL